MSRLAAAGDRAGAGRVRTAARAARARARRRPGAGHAGARGGASPRGAGRRPRRRRGRACRGRPFTLVGRDRELRRARASVVAAARRRRRGRGDHGRAGDRQDAAGDRAAGARPADGARFASCAALDLGGAAPLSLWAELIRELSRDLPPPPLDAAWPADLAVLAPDIERRFGREPVERSRAAPGPRARTPVRGGGRAGRAGRLAAGRWSCSWRTSTSRMPRACSCCGIWPAAVGAAAGTRDPHAAPAAAERRGRRARAGAAGPGRAAAELTLGPLPADALARAGPRGGPAATRRGRRRRGGRRGQRAAGGRGRPGARPRRARAPGEPARRGAHRARAALAGRAARRRVRRGRRS